MSYSRQGSRRSNSGSIGPDTDVRAFTKGDKVKLKGLTSYGEKKYNGVTGRVIDNYAADGSGRIAVKIKSGQVLLLTNSNMTRTSRGSSGVDERTLQDFTKQAKDRYYDGGGRTSPHPESNNWRSALGAIDTTERVRSPSYGGKSDSESLYSLGAESIYGQGLSIHRAPPPTLRNPLGTMPKQPRSRSRSNSRASGFSEGDPMLPHGTLTRRGGSPALSRAFNSPSQSPAPFVRKSRKPQHHRRRASSGGSSKNGYEGGGSTGKPYRQREEQEYAPRPTEITDNPGASGYGARTAPTPAAMAGPNPGLNPKVGQMKDRIIRVVKDQQNKIEQLSSALLKMQSRLKDKNRELAYLRHQRHGKNHNFGDMFVRVERHGLVDETQLAFVDILLDEIEKEFGVPFSAGMNTT